jgi:hypothetical protein
MSSFWFQITLRNVYAEENKPLLAKLSDFVSFVLYSERKKSRERGRGSDIWGNVYMERREYGRLHICIYTWICKFLGGKAYSECVVLRVGLWFVRMDRDV